jgi:hypothetical protein
MLFLNFFKWICIIRNSEILFLMEKRTVILQHFQKTFSRIPCTVFGIEPNKAFGCLACWESCQECTDYQDFNILKFYEMS